MSGRQELRAWADRSVVRDAELAVRLGISRPYMSQIFHGERRPGLELLLLIAEVTGIQLVAWRENGDGIAVDRRKRKPISACLPVANSDAA
jgi:transcriptional regulator with XRE-family HTH domain